MKIEVLQEQLVAGLNIVLRAVASRAQLPILSNVLIEAKNDGLLLSATDLEVGIQTKVPAKVSEEGKVTVPAKIFSEFLNSLNPGKIELIQEKETLILKATKYSSKFQTISSEEFPAFAEIEKGSELCMVDATKFKESVSLVVFAAAHDSLRPVLTGVLLEFGKKSLKLVATDGFRLGVEEIEVQLSGQEQSLLVPSRVVSEVVRLLDNQGVKVGCLSKSNQIYFEVGDTLVVSQLLSGNYPDYKKIIPKEFTTTIKVAKDELSQAIKAAHIFARDNSNMVRWQVEDSKLTLLSNSPEKGECVVEVPVELEGDKIEIIFNAKYLIDYLSITTGDNLEIGLGSKLSPAILKDLKRGGGYYIVMPINA